MFTNPPGGQSVLFSIVLLIFCTSAADAQQPWQPRTSGASASLGAVHYASPTNIWTVGGIGTILYSTDGGDTWSPKTIPNVATTQCCNSVRFVGESTVFIGGLHAVLRSTDAGANWGGVVDNGNQGKNGLYPVSQDVAWAIVMGTVGFSPAIGHYRYTFNGDGSVSTWSSMNVATVNDSLSGIFFIDADNGWSVGGPGRINRISNASGASPTIQTQISPTTENLYGIFMRSLTLGWIVGRNGTLLKTTDGTNWTALTSPTASNLEDVFFVDDLHGWIVGDAGAIFATTDGGSTWQPETSGVSTRLRAVFVDGTSFAVGDAGVILKKSGAPPPPQITTVTPAAGPLAGGQTVTISGDNLTDPSAVTFDADAANVVSNTSTSINVTTPPHAAGVVSVSVTTAGGSATQPSSYTYVPPPSITAILPDHGPLAGGQATTITGTDLATTTAIRFDGIDGALGAVTPASVEVTTPPHAAGAVTVEATTAGGVAQASSAYVYLGTFDPDGDDTVGPADVIYLINYFFAGGEAPKGSADANADGSVTLLDVIYLINHLFANGPAPVA